MALHHVTNLPGVAVGDDDNQHLMRLERIDDGHSNMLCMNNAWDNPRVL